MFLKATKKECSICKVSGVPLKQINIPFPPFKVWYCKDCWEGVTEKIKPKVKKMQEAGLSRAAAQNELLKDIPRLQEEFDAKKGH